MRRNLNYLQDSSFLLQLDNEFNKTYQVKINVLDLEEAPIESIEGRVLPGSTITIDGNSSVRRTCSITFVADEDTNDLTDIGNLLSVNKKIEILVGLENNIDRKKYEDIIWFPQGIYVIVQPAITQNANGCTISLSCKDKMCLLNGERGGALPTSVLFHAKQEKVILLKVSSMEDIYKLVYTGDINEYTIYYFEEQVKEEKEEEEVQILVEYYYRQDKDQGIYEVPNADAVGTKQEVSNRIYDIIETLVRNYGQEDQSRVFINDVPLEIKQLVRQEGVENEIIYCKRLESGKYVYSWGIPEDDPTGWVAYQNGDDIGYRYTDFTYPNKLISNIGDSVCTILDKIKNTLGNYEYFYDIDGNFVFQEVKNYLNSAYDPTVQVRLDGDRIVYVNEHNPLPYNDLSIIEKSNYKVEYNSNSKIAYVFTEGTGLISSYSNTLSYSNLKNDFHIQGKKDDKNAIHYHLIVKRKPKELLHKGSGIYGYQRVVKVGDTGIRLATDVDEASEITEVEDYYTKDQRAELYLQGMDLQMKGLRPDIYQQELLDLFDDIYDFQQQKFKKEVVDHPNKLDYFFDYLEPYDGLGDVSVDVINTKIYSQQSDDIKRLFKNKAPNCIIIDAEMDPATRDIIILKCLQEGQEYCLIDRAAYEKIKLGRKTYTAQEIAQELLYQYTNYNETIVLQAIPIYHLEPNTRITVYNQKAGMYGDYVIKSISLPVDAGGTMTINAIRALERI